MATILGIDLGKFKSVVCAFDHRTEEYGFETIPTDPEAFRDLLVRTAPEVVLFETCTAAGWVHDLCGELGLPCRVVNPLGEAWQWKKVKRKTDRDDALKLVRLHRLGELPAVHVPGPEARQRRSLIEFRQRLISQRTATRNRIRARFQSRGLALPGGARAWSAAARAEWRRAYARPLAECGPTETWRGELDADLTLLEALEVQVAAVEKALDARAEADESVERLMTIPGVGPRTAEAVVAYLGDPGRFRGGRQVSAYAGLVPRQFQSGEVDRKGRITKRGPAVLRKLLVECAWQVRRHDAWGAAVVERISRGQKGRVKSAVVALARKLLVRCWAMLRDGKAWDPPGAAAA
jgi:transposase